MQVSSNGFLSFGEPYDVPTFSGGNFDTVLSPPIIAPFWDDINILNGGAIYHRQILDSDPVFDLLQQAIFFQYPELGTFYPSLVFVATWDHVAAYESIYQGHNNTFQCLLATNGSVSFVAFNYVSIEWGSGRTLIGVSAGDRRNFITHHASLSQEVLQLDNTTIFYRIDGKYVVCTL